MESIVYVKEFARYDLKSYMLITTWNHRNNSYAFTINKLNDGHMRCSVIIPLKVMTIMLNRINHTMVSLREQRSWLSSKTFTPLSIKFYKLFCVPVYELVGRVWSLSAKLRVSYRRVFIGLHELKPLTKAVPKVMYLHYDAFFQLFDALDLALTEVLNHHGLPTPIAEKPSIWTCSSSY